MKFLYQPLTTSEFYPVIYVFTSTQKYSKYRFEFYSNKWVKKRCKWYCSSTKYNSIVEAATNLAFQLSTEKGQRYKNPASILLLKKKYPEYFV